MGQWQAGTVFQRTLDHIPQPQQVQRSASLTYRPQLMARRPTKGATNVVGDAFIWLRPRSVWALLKILHVDRQATVSSAAKVLDAGATSCGFSF